MSSRKYPLRFLETIVDESDVPIIIRGEDRNISK